LKFLKRLTLVLLAILVIGYFAGNYALSRLGEKYRPKIQTALESRGLVFKEFSYGKIVIHSPRAVAIKDIDVDFKLNKQLYGEKSFDVNFHAQQIIISVASFSSATVVFSFDDFDIMVKSDNENAGLFGEFEHAYFTHQQAIAIKSPEAAAVNILAQLDRLFAENKATGISLSGVAKIEIGGEPVSLGLRTYAENDSVYLRFNTADVISTAEKFAVQLADKEAEVLAAHPSLVPDMIEITRDARQKSVAYRKADPDFPEDAFRHVYWSYHLTRQLGPGIAQQITDAHETAPGNSKAERAMDFHNNELARELAGIRLSESQLVNLVLTDRNIIRSPAEVR
jgi:hypothetical protein